PADDRLDRAAAVADGVAPEPPPAALAAVPVGAGCVPGGPALRFQHGLFLPAPRHLPGAVVAVDMGCTQHPDAPAGLAGRAADSAVDISEYRALRGVFARDGVV